MVEPLNTKAWQSALDALGTVKANQLEPDLRIAVSAYISALPSLPVVDGGDLAERLAYRVGNPSAWPEGFDQKASDLFRSAVALISSQKQEIERLSGFVDGYGRLDAEFAAAESRILSLEEEVKVLREAVERSNTALNDWLNVYAEELCDPDRVAEARARISDGGTIAYIASVTEQNRQALSEGEKNG